MIISAAHSTTVEHPRRRIEPIDGPMVDGGRSACNDRAYGAMMGRLDDELMLPVMPSGLQDRLERGEAGLQMLVDAFPDPGDAYVASPTPLAIRDLYRLYRDSYDEDFLPELYRALQRRRRDERWDERRARFQAQRVRSREDALLEAEAQVWAMLGIDFHARRIRGLIIRYDMLSDHCEAQLERIGDGESGSFTTGMRDALKELREIEHELASIMPQLDFAERARRLLDGRADSVNATIDDIQEKLSAVGISGKAQRVRRELTLLEGGTDD